jgi:ABC-2 type transport system ATP-binding protein
VAETMIEAEGIAKSFGETRALDGVDISVERGRILGLLGPNGSGKTTFVRILTTLLRPDSGRAWVAGHDVLEDATALRTKIGLAGQYAAVDELLTGRENLELVGLWYHLPKVEYRRRARDILERLGLSGAADRRVDTYSGGMRRRLDIGASLIARPPVLFLDEPTTGLDPRTRNALWEFLEELVDEGTTVLLTTQYMEEAERLASSIVVLDLGRVIARGTALELKEEIGGSRLEVRVVHESDLERVGSILAEVSRSPAQTDAHQRLVTVSTDGGASLLIEAAGRLEAERIEIEDLGIRHPSLDDVFLSLTGTVRADELEGS